MSAKKNINMLLSPEEFEEFAAFLKSKKISQKALAEIVCMSEVQTGINLRKKCVPKSWRELVELREENVALKDRIKKIEESLK